MEGNLLLSLLRKARARRVKVSQKAKEKMEMEQMAMPCQPRAKAKANEVAVVPKEKERAKEKGKAAVDLLAKEAKVKARDRTVLPEIGAPSHVFFFLKVSAPEARTAPILMTVPMQLPLKDTPNQRQKLKQRPKQQQLSLCLLLLGLF